MMKGWSNSCQLIGIGLTVVGITVVRDWLDKAADAATDVKRGLARSVALRRERLGRLWARRRRRGVGVSASAALAVAVSTEATATRQRVERATISDRDRLALLDDRLEALIDRLDKAEESRSAEWEQRLGEQRDELRNEIRAITRRGWQLILAGQGFLALGTLIGLWA